MRYFIVALLWLSPILVGWLTSKFRLAALRKRLNHDRILHIFSDVRDAIALKAINGEVDENSELFRFFYETTSRRITQHKEYGICFSRLVHFAMSDPNPAISQKTKILLRQIKRGDDEVKELAYRYAQAFEIMLAEAWFIVRAYHAIHALRLTHSGFVKWVAKQNLVPQQVRSFARFTTAMVHAAGHTLGEPAMIPA